MYVGAPYYAAISAMRGGADLATVFCENSAFAAVPIKSFSPDLMVLPVIPSEPTQVRAAVQEVEKTWLPKLDVLVIGPGLGRSEAAGVFVEGVITAAKSLSRQIPLVLDGDALFFLNSNLTLVKGCEARTILTPNGMVRVSWRVSQGWISVFGCIPASGVAHCPDPSAAQLVWCAAGWAGVPAPVGRCHGRHARADRTQQEGPRGMRSAAGLVVYLVF